MTVNQQSGRMQGSGPNGPNGYNPTSSATDQLSADANQVSADFGRLAENFRLFLNDCETLFKDAKALSGEGTQLAQQELRRRIGLARDQLNTLGSAAGEKARWARGYTEDYVRREPITAIGIAAAVGAVVGIIIARR
jgi:ElaB/YqjD/DUF883 family membrane-anchored ribosome-binding protein